MNVAHFECPACKCPIEMPQGAVKHGVTCPDCEMIFVPENVELLEKTLKGKSVERGPSGYDAKAEARSTQTQRGTPLQTEKIHNRAYFVEAASVFSAIIGVIVIFCSAVQSISSGQPTGGYFLGGGLISLGVLLFIIAQLLYIRCSLENWLTND